MTLPQGQEPEEDWACAETGVNQRTPWWRGWAFILRLPTTTTRRHCASAAGRSVWKWTKFYYKKNKWCNLMNMYILIYINCIEKIRGMHVRWNYPPCIQRCNKECLPFNTTLVLRRFIPGFSVTWRCWFLDNMRQLAVWTEQIYTNNVKVIKTFHYSVNMPAFCKVEQIHVHFVLVN